MCFSQWFEPAELLPDCQLFEKSFTMWSSEYSVDSVFDQVVLVDELPLKVSMTPEMLAHSSAAGCRVKNCSKIFSPAAPAHWGPHLLISCAGLSSRPRPLFALSLIHIAAEARDESDMWRTSGKHPPVAIQVASDPVLGLPLPPWWDRPPATQGEW